MTAAPADEYRDHGRYNERHLVGSAGAGIAEQEVGQGDQHDEAGDGNDRFRQSKRLGRFRAVHTHFP